MRRPSLVLSAIFLLMLVAGCSGLAYTPAPTPYPVDYIPTLIAQTVESGQSNQPTSSPVIIPSDTQRAAIKAMQRVLETIARDGSAGAMTDDMASFAERETVVDAAGFLERDQRYGA